MKKLFVCFQIIFNWFLISFMLFTSPVFIFLFLPLVLCGQFLIKTPFQNIWLTLASLLFYFWDETSFTAILLISILFNYLSGLGIEYMRSISSLYNSRVHWLLAFSIFINLIILLFFKYTKFLLETFNAITHPLGIYPITIPIIKLPVGISFFTFHGLSYIIDVYRQKVKVQRNLLSLALYFTFFPQLIAGPIIRYHDVAHLIEQRYTSYEQFAKGAVRFTVGLSKKTLIANVLGANADTIFNSPVKHVDASLAWLGMLTYSFQIYFDFSAYSDMAIGLASMFGITFLENFNYPYTSRSVKDFWRRWHISLSSWFRDYLYIPLGGNSGSVRRAYSNVLVVFILCGIWHGASWNFLIWGIYHGSFLILERTRFGLLQRAFPRILQHFYVLSVVFIGWIIFRAPTLQYFSGFLKAFLGLGNHEVIIIPARQYLEPKFLVVMFIAILGSFGSYPMMIGLSEKAVNSISYSQYRMLGNLLLILLGLIIFISLFILSIMIISNGLYDPFIYFRF